MASIQLPQTGPKHSFFPMLCEACLGKLPVAEHKFHPTRKWRFDFAFVPEKVALEVEGGVWTGGRHTRGAGFSGDMAKYNAAAILGWRILRVTPEQMRNGAVFGILKEVFKS
jgi:hypothetical protein